MQESFPTKEENSEKEPALEARQGEQLPANSEELEEKLMKDVEQLDEETAGFVEPFRDENLDERERAFLRDSFDNFRNKVEGALFRAHCVLGLSKLRKAGENTYIQGDVRRKILYSLKDDEVEPGSTDLLEEEALLRSQRYVDEDGNLRETPEDPKIRRIIREVIASRLEASQVREEFERENMENRRRAMARLREKKEESSSLDEESGRRLEAFAKTAALIKIISPL